MRLIKFRLKVDPETGESLCEVCGESLSSLVDDDRALKCKTCGMRVLHGTI